MNFGRGWRGGERPGNPSRTSGALRPAGPLAWHDACGCRSLGARAQRGRRSDLQPGGRGQGLVQSYRHVEPDGSHFEGHGIFTVDPVHHDVLWYYIDSSGVPPGAAARCTWQDGVLRVERHGGGGWTRHSIWVQDDVLTHVTELRSAGQDDGGGALETGMDGKGPVYRPFMRSVFHKA